MNTALSLGERVAGDGAFTSRRGPGEGSRKTEEQFKWQTAETRKWKIENGNCASLQFPASSFHFPVPIFQFPFSSFHFPVPIFQFPFSSFPEPRFLAYQNKPIFGHFAILTGPSS